MSDDQSTNVSAKTRPAPPRVDRLPPWDVLLHDDDENDMVFVVETIVMLTTLPTQDAVERMLEAHHSGVALLVNTHQEHAELLEEQFTSRGLTVTIEPSR
jgi:ATP-dependent Clp protease adaptor protein ClpS